MLGPRNGRGVQVGGLSPLLLLGWGCGWVWGLGPAGLLQGFWPQRCALRLCRSRAPGRRLPAVCARASAARPLLWNPLCCMLRSRLQVLGVAGPQARTSCRLGSAAVLHAPDGLPAGEAGMIHAPVHTYICARRCKGRRKRLLPPPLPLPLRSSTCAAYIPQTHTSLKHIHTCTRKAGRHWCPLPSY